MSIRDVRALWPALLCGGFAGWAGTLPGAAQAQWTMLAHAALFLVFVWVVIGSRWTRSRVGGVVGKTGEGELADEGTGGRGWLPFLLAWGAALPAWLASPVPRAGATAWWLLPLFLIVPRAVARSWATDAQRRLGAAAFSVFVAGLAGWALWTWRSLGTDGASLPLGHHNLLAVVLVTSLPLAVLPWRQGGAGRVVATLAGVLGVAALLATRSLSGVAAGVVVLLAALAWCVARARPRRAGRVPVVLAAAMLILGVVACGAALFGGRLRSIAAGLDVSTLARWSYLEAGWRGVVERPLLGWGPGSTAWTVHEHLRPMPGIHPPEQIVADFHSLPLELLYELGAVGVLLLLAAGWILVRGLRRRPIADSGLATASALGLLGFAVASLAGARLAVTALPVTLGVVAGAGLAALGRAEPEPRRTETQETQTDKLVGALVAFAAVACFVHFVFGADLAVSRSERGRIEDAVALDPSFPLYRWRLAQSEFDETETWRAAEDARGVAVLWWSAGRAADLAGDSEHAATAYDRACALSPFGAVAPFRRSLLAVDEAASAGSAARAIAAQPWLLASTEWVGERAWLPLVAVQRLAATDAIEQGWRDELTSAWRRMRRIGESTDIRILAYDADKDPSTSLSLFTFRRAPEPLRLDEIRLDAARLAEIQHLPPATSLLSTDASLFVGPGCALSSAAER